jgi:uncharacterized protein (DUF885 family)
MKKLLLVLAAWAILPIARPANLFAQTEDARLDANFREYLEASFRLHPFMATGLGDHRYDAALEDLSKAGRGRWLELDRASLARLNKEIRYKELTRAGQIDFEIFRHELEKSLWLERNTRPFEEDARVYNEYINDSVYLLLTQSSLPKETNVANCLARMAEIPKVIAAARENLANPAKPILETAIRQNRGAISFYEHDIIDLAGETPRREELKAAGQKLGALLRDYQKFLENDLLPRARGEWRLGRARFDRKLDLELDAGVSANQVLADAETEFQRVTRDMYVIARQLWAKELPGQPLPPDDADGRRETTTKVIEAIGREHSKPDQLTADARASIERIRSFIRSANYLRLPDPDRCQVIEMPEFQRGNSLAYLNGSPPLDTNAPSFYAVSPPSSDLDPKRAESLLEEYNSHMLQILTIHEAYPGHYVQLEYANRNRSLIRKVFGSGVYIEGWAVYGEQTMLDQGYGEGDPALRLMQLKFYLRAVANAIIDNKMHTGRMTDEDVLRFLTQEGFQSTEEARLKIVRAKQTSCQLSTYFVGRMAMYRLHQTIEREMGSRFNLARFHEAILNQSSVPVKYLPELVRAALK